MAFKGVNSETVTSQEVLCCTAKSWSRVLGWIHTVVGAIGLLVFSVIFISVLAAIGSHRRDGSLHDLGPEFKNVNAAPLAAAAILLSLIIIGIFLLALVGGILLVKGVNEENPSKLQCWLIIDGICIAFTILIVMLKLGSGNFGAVASDLISILLSLFCFWVVNLHRKELLSAGRTGSII